MADDKVRVLDRLACRGLKDQVVVAVKVGLDLAVGVVYAVDHVFHAVCRMVGHLDVSAVAGEGHHAFDSDLLLRVKRVGSGKAEGVSLVLNAVAV